jgi:(p)ppGpp synthase/HD superfamily hydrolase
MTVHNPILDAMLFITTVHADQKRKYTGDPYILHPTRVAMKLSHIGFETEVVAAALLHDVVEDCGVTLDSLTRSFGERVATLVGEVTNPSKPSDGNRAARKVIDLQHLAKASYAGASIKLADILDNVPSIVEHDPKFAAVYIPEKIAQVEVLRHGHPILFARTYELLAWATATLDVPFAVKEEEHDTRNG